LGEKLVKLFLEGIHVKCVEFIQQSSYYYLLFIHQDELRFNDLMEHYDL